MKRKEETRIVSASENAAKVAEGEKMSERKIFDYPWPNDPDHSLIRLLKSVKWTDKDLPNRPGGAR